MSNYLQSYDISYQLPNGNLLFSNISATFSDKITALIGRNGVGKSILGKILSGKILPTSGQVINAESVFYLPQTYQVTNSTTIGDLLGIAHILKALQHIDEGSILEADFAVVDDHWDIENEASTLLSKLDLPQYSLTDPASTLSGGEQMRIRIAAAFLSSAAVLILDEPSNHLDQFYKEKLWKMITAWNGQVILITHDPFLLNRLENIVELSPNALIRFKGSFAQFREERKAAQRRAVQALATIKQQEENRLQTIEKQLKRQQKRTKQATSSRKNQNQAKILMDAQKNRSDVTKGKTELKYTQARELGESRIEAARDEVDESDTIFLHEITVAKHPSKVAVQLTNITLPYLQTRLQPLNLTINSGQRIAVIGQNGTGKSLLLKVIEGNISPKTGTIERSVSALYLDQHLTTLHKDKSVLEQISLNRTQEEISILRMQLSQLGLNATHIEKKSALLSGGERLKSALAICLYGHHPAELLLLDEPNNHLDLESLKALESMLQNYQGTLIVASHDMEFLDRIGIDVFLQQVEGQWLLEYKSH